MSLEPQELRERFEELLEGAPLGIAVLDTELRFVELNERLVAMRLMTPDGQPREACLGRRASEVLPPSPAAEQFLRCARRVLDTGRSVDREVLALAPEARPEARHTYCVTFHPSRRDAVITGVYAFVEDITARHQLQEQQKELLARERAARARAEAAAQALGESEARYRAILAALDEGVVVQSREGDIVTANASAEHILGLSVDQLAGRTSMDPRWRAIHEDGSPFPGSEHPAMVALRTGEPVRSVPMGVRRPDGSLIWLSINAQPLRRPGEAEPYMTVSSFFDVTGFKKALQDIHLSEQRFRSLVEATTQMVWTTDATGMVRPESASWMAYTGQDVKTSTAPKGWLEAVHPEDREHVLAEWRRAVARKEPLRLESRVRRHDGEYRQFLVRAVPVLAPDGSIREWIGTHADISEARRAESERARLLLEAQQAVRARDEFLTVAAHELRTPLTSLRLHLQLLLRQLARASPEVAEQLASRSEALERQVGRLAGLIYTLLDVSRLTTGRLSLEPREVDLGLMVGQLAESFGDEFRRLGASITVQGPEEPLVGVWDPLRVEQVVVNLLSNAVRYGGGKPVEVRLWREGTMAVVSVKDQGIGISQEDLSRIFGKFERAVSERHYGGLGLGLYISRQLLDAMEGSIQAESTPGQGSTFTVRLPLTRTSGGAVTSG
ncbi:PAS domain S-box protein [Myxococcus sp. RHSTA-1-4]|uniref:PAS domain-containing sensor histidine kinase n=1 Tax=Myxococcus sp. RHSTA-1-4 TaxID=2874601 RepID=UPI001CBDD8F7|nr:PAS domain S-box protein [Myxococcus sp. RHSTA-1-4]MBZ4420354.1 PAS domain S-box protein [Myxococcus sp. RHSTA-1-4]